MSGRRVRRRCGSTQRPMSGRPFPCATADSPRSPIPAITMWATARRASIRRPTKTIGGLIEEARRRDDSVVAHISDFIRADERTHIRKGQHIIKVMTDLGMQELELRTRELFTECLVSLGAVKLDGDLFTMTREDI